MSLVLNAEENRKLKFFENLMSVTINSLFTSISGHSRAQHTFQYSIHSFLKIIIHFNFDFIRVKLSYKYI